MHPPDSELAIGAVEAGCVVLRAKYGTPLVRHDKSLMDFATDADLEAERAVVDVLRDARPSDEFIGEEHGSSGVAATGRSWLIDPLCGTLNFAAETPLVAVNVALRTAGAITAAASADPFTHEVFWTDGTKAWLRRHDTDVALTPSARSKLIDLNLDATGSSDAHRLTTVRMLASPAFTTAFRPRVMSTTLALAWVAAGRRAGYVTEGDLEGSVHFTAGIALCQAAGCVVTGLHGQALHTGAGGLVAAADDETHRLLLEIIEQGAHRGR